MMKRLSPTIILVIAALLLAGCSSGGILQGSSWPGMTLDEDTAYVAYEQFVYAIDLEDGSMKWRYPSEEERNVTFYAPPEPTEEGLVIVGSYDRMVYGLSPNGTVPEVVWEFDGIEGGAPMGRIIGGPTAIDGGVLVPSGNWSLYALSLNSGEPLQAPFQAEEALWSAPLFDGERVYFTSLDHRLYAFDYGTGRQAWTIDLIGAITDTPALEDGLLLVGTFARNVNAVEAESGDLVWTINTTGGVWGNPVSNNGDVFFGDDAGFGYSVSLETGQENWRVELQGPVRASPAIVDGTVYFVTEVGTVEAYQADSGRPNWPTPATLDARLMSDPQMSDGGLLVPATDNDCLIFSIDPDSGASRCFFLKG